MSARVDGVPAFVALPPYRIVNQAFGQAMVDRLLDLVRTRESAFTTSGIGRGDTQDTTVRRSRRLRDLGAIRPELEAGFRAVLPETLDALGMAPFSLARLSLELAAHGDGDFYKRHIDTFIGSQRDSADRILTGVYYFHAEPKAFEGGELRLSSLLPEEQGGTHLDIAPRNDSLVLFPAWVPHAVQPVSAPGIAFAQSRFAINCWYIRSAG